MNIIHQTLKKLYHYWLGSKKLHKDQNSGLSNIHTISIVLYPNLMIDILTTHPSIDNMSEDTILTEAEKFAELLLYVSNDLLDSKITSIIEKKINKSDSILEKLFYENVISFYGILKKEFDSINNQNSPLIRPRSVFNK